MNRSARQTCDDVRDLLPLAAGQDLSEVAARRVWNHLAGCMGCRREYGRCLDARRALALLEPGPAAAAQHGLGEAFFADLESDILARLPASPAARVERRRLPVARGLVGRWLGLVTAAAGVLLAGSLALSWGGDAGLLQRPAMGPLSPVTPLGQGPAAAPLIQLSYPQGLEAQRQAELLFSREHDGLLHLASYPRRKSENR